MEKDISLLSMFDEEIGILSKQGSIKVMNMEYINSETSKWEELFAGYSTLHAVTYSSSIDFIGKLLPMFENIEIIFGFERVLGGLHDILAYQQVTLEELQSAFNKKEKELLKRIDGGSLKLYLLKDRVSHKKMYMLGGRAYPKGNNRISKPIQCSFFRRAAGKYLCSKWRESLQ